MTIKSFSSQVYSDTLAVLIQIEVNGEKATPLYKGAFDAEDTLVHLFIKIDHLATF